MRWSPVHTDRLAFRAPRSLRTTLHIASWYSLHIASPHCSTIRDFMLSLTIESVLGSLTIAFCSLRLFLRMLHGWFQVPPQDSEPPYTFLLASLELPIMQILTRLSLLFPFLWRHLVFIFPLNIWFLWLFADLLILKFCHPLHDSAFTPIA